MLFHFRGTARILGTTPLPVHAYHSNIFKMFSLNNVFLPGCYLEEARKVVAKAHENGRPIGCFISELAISAAGMVIPPLGYFKELYQ